MGKGIQKPTIKNIVDLEVNDKTYYDDYMYTSFSMLKTLLTKSPLHFDYYSKNRMKESAAMKFGTAFHSYLLEPEKFKEDFAIEPNVDKRTTLGKVTWTKFVDKNIRKEWVSEDNISIIKEMALTIKGNKHYSLFNDCLMEHIHLWKNESKDILCKCKVDAINFNKGYIIDVKTTRDASPKTFEEIIIKNKYHMQAAYYLDGTGLDTYYIFAIEKTRPYGVSVYKMGKSIIEKGREEYIKGISIMQEMKTLGITGYNNDKIKTVTWS